MLFILHNFNCLFMFIPWLVILMYYGLHMFYILICIFLFGLIMNSMNQIIPAATIYNP